MNLAFFPEKYRAREGWVNLRQASVWLNKSPNYLASIRNIGKWPSQVPIKQRGKGEVSILVADLPKLAEVITKKK